MRPQKTISIRTVSIKSRLFFKAAVMTHKEGLYPYKERLAPRAFVIDLESVELPLENMVQANILFGESIIFSQMLVHGSMNNTSNSPRLTFQMRYADLCEEAFRKNFYKTPVGSELVWKEEPLKKK